MRKALYTPYRVLRVVPVDPIGEDESFVATLDLINRDFNLVLLDCKLCIESESYVMTANYERLMRCYRDHGFEAADYDDELELSDLIDDQIALALCRFLGLDLQDDEAPGKTLYKFLDGPAWQDWIKTHRVPSLEVALLCYLAIKD